MTGTDAAGPLAQCVAVSRRFGEFTAVRDVDLRVDRGEIVGLLGANGAGKTTLIRLLLGLLATSAGEVELFGEPPSRGTRRRIGYVPQGLGLYDDLTVSENLEFSAAVFGSRRPGSAEPAGLPGALRPYAAALVGGLSLGVQRRVAFAQALAHQPELLILDEPTSGVDPLGRARLWDTISEAADRGVGVLVTTHYMEEAQECGRLVIMADGGIVAQGTAAQIVGDARVTVVEAPSWTAAFGRLEDCGMAVALAGRTLRVPGASPEAVLRALADADARAYEAPATLEERFFQLVLPPVAAGASA
jgi:ABC-2 type transport system ATP-binding protein